jgi:hypothetical protein
MLRPTPGRLLYLVIGLVIGAIVLTMYSSVEGVPAFLPVGVGRPAATQPKVPTQFSGAKLTRVVSANQESAKAGVTLRVNSLELYDDGFSLTYSIIGGQAGEPAPVLQPERFTAVDDLGGSYSVSAVGSTSTVSPGLSTGYLSFTPALSSDAKTLTIGVPHLLVVAGIADPSAPRIVDGPWQVLVSLK